MHISVLVLEFLREYHGKTSNVGRSLKIYLEFQWHLHFLNFGLNPLDLSLLISRMVLALGVNNNKQQILYLYLQPLPRHSCASLHFQFIIPPSGLWPLFRLTTLGSSAWTSKLEFQNFLKTIRYYACIFVFSLPRCLRLLSQSRSPAS